MYAGYGLSVLIIPDIPVQLIHRVIGSHDLIQFPLVVRVNIRFYCLHELYLSCIRIRRHIYCTVPDFLRIGMVQGTPNGTQCIQNSCNGVNGVLLLFLQIRANRMQHLYVFRIVQQVFKGGFHGFHTVSPGKPCFFHSWPYQEPANQKKKKCGRRNKCPALLLHRF